MSAQIGSTGVDLTVTICFDPDGDGSLRCMDLGGEEIPGRLAVEIWAALAPKARQAICEEARDNAEPDAESADWAADDYRMPGFEVA